MIRKAPDCQNERPGESQHTFRKIFKVKLDGTKFRSTVLIEYKDEMGEGGVTSFF